MNKSSGLLLFILGAVIGATAAWKLTKTKYETIANDEIESVKRAYKNVKTNGKETVNVVKSYADIISNENYAGNGNKIASAKNSDDYPRPYVITPEEFSENFEYDTVDITYFADGVLADENNEPIEDIENTIGRDAVRHFGEYEPDSVYVRNERLKCDYEILRDERRYADIKRSKTKEV